MPLAPMPRPVNVVDVSVPVLPLVLPVSSTFNVSVPLPIKVRMPWILSTMPPSTGSRLPTLIVLLPVPVLTIVLVVALVL